MSDLKRFSAILCVFIIFISACKAGTPSPIPITTLDAVQGGKISYGTVAGAATQAAAMSKILINIQNTCGEKPQIGRVFQFKGTKTVGVFFTVTDHSKRNMKLAGLLMSAASGPKQVEAALLSNDASRFGKTINPMIQQLLNIWQPGGRAAASSPSSGEQSAQSGNGRSASSARLHTVAASDNSATIGIADGWQLDLSSAGGAMSLMGPNGERAVCGAVMPAVDPNNPQQVQAVRYGVYKGTGTILYPYHQDLARAYPELLQAWRRALNLAPAKLQMEKIEPIKGAGNCILVTAHLDADGHGMKKLIDNVCQSQPTQWGAYTVTRNFNIMTDAQSEREQGTVMAMFLSIKINQQVMNQQMQQKLAHKQQSDRQWLAFGQQQSDRIRAQSQAAQKSFAARQAANDAQHNDWNQSQINNARNGQGFSNYLLDQTVVQGNDINGAGAVGHATVWNSTADALVKLDPNRFEIVDTPNYWLGTDFHK
jgi:hypothetical protein